MSTSDVGWEYVMLDVWYAAEVNIESRVWRKKRKLDEEVEWEHYGSGAWLAWSPQLDCFAKVEKVLNSYGRDGWEVVGIHQRAGEFIDSRRAFYVLKRERRQFAARLRR